MELEGCAVIDPNTGDILEIFWHVPSASELRNMMGDHWPEMVELHIIDLMVLDTEKIEEVVLWTNEASSND